MKPHGIAIITLADIYQKQNTKTQETYYLLTYQLHRTLTAKYLALTGESKQTLTSNKNPLFLFNEKKKFARHLTPGAVYWIAYTSRQKPNKTHYFHVQDWRILGDKLSIQRSWNLLLKDD